MEAGQLGPHVDRARVEHRLRAEAGGELEPGGAEVDGDDPVDAPVEQRRDRGEPDRAAPEHRDRLAGAHLGLVDGVHADGERLGEGGDVERQVAGHGEEPPARAASRTSSSGVSPPSPAPLPMRPSSSSPGCTTTRSPTATRSTSAPTQSTTPAISWPRHMGVPVGPASPPCSM